MPPNLQIKKRVATCDRLRDISQDSARELEHITTTWPRHGHPVPQEEEAKEEEEGFNQTVLNGFIYIVKGELYTGADRIPKPVSTPTLPKNMQRIRIARGPSLSRHEMSAAESKAP